jgi:CIC family chloride channel protein
MENKRTAHAPALNPLLWLPQLWEASRKRVRPQAKLLGLSLLVGIISGLGAVLFFSACQLVFHYALGEIVGYRPTKPGGEPPMFAESITAFRPWLLLIVPTLGGLASGLIVYSLAPEAEGHGTDAAIAAYHYHGGQIRPRVPLIKLVASAITLGTGGSGGREGPIAQIGAGFGSYLGAVLHLGPADRRVLMAAGMGAGIAAIFRAPLAGALFAAEVLYRSPDFESDVIIPATLASVTAYSTFGLFFGWEPLFYMPPEVLASLSFNNPLQLFPYLLLALAMVILASIYVRTFYGVTHLFHQLSIRPHFRPALGALLSGAVGLTLYFLFGRDPQVLSVMAFGYGVLQDALTAPPAAEASMFAALALLAVALGKILTTSLTIGSGGSGGVFGPSMVIGGCAGGALGIALHQVMPRLVPHPAGFVVVGMAGFFAAAAKTPFSTLVMVSELTGNYGLLLPTLWVCAIAFVLSDDNSIYSAQVDRRSLSPAHRGDHVRDVLGDVRIRPLITTDRVLLRPDERLCDVVKRLRDDPFHALPVVDGHCFLLGVVSLEEVHLASQSPHIQDWIVAADMMRTDVEPLHANDPMDYALELFVESGLTSLPVVDDSPEKKVIGTVNRADVSKLYLQHMHGPNGRNLA